MKLHRLAVILLLSIAGCSGGDQPRLGAVHGTVTLDDAPLAGAMVVFTPADGGRQSFAVQFARPT